MLPERLPRPLGTHSGKLCLLLAGRSGASPAHNRSDYSAGPEPSFYGMPAFLENPVMQPPNAPQFGGMNVSETHSVWILANNTSPTPPPLSPEQTSTLNAIAHVDMFVRPVYRMNPEVLSVQWGFENALFKSFPGTGDNLNQGPYDPRVRSWYTGAKLNQLTPSSFVVVDPYLSAFGRGWVMTTAKSIFSSQNGSFIGVASIQTQLSEFSKLLSSFAYEGANVGIYKATATGTMLASTQVVFDNTAPGTTPATYANTSSPNLSTAFWTGTIVPSLSANINTVTSNYGSATYVDPSTGTSYLVLWKTLSVYATDSAQSASNPSWVVVGAVPLAQLQSTVDAATSALKASLPLILGVGAGIFIAVLAVVLLLVRVFANRVARPLAKLCAETDVISNNIGAADLFAGVDVAGKGGEEARSGVDEMDAFREGFYAMVATIREGSVRVGKKGEWD
ncbi:hypothetical protein BC830DRAFT_193728 [Chytriomyces sp. MP71]|nr:hypothetical protein BC830DRAFT_193728 [Chytriomyces sp. MP71]